MSELEKKIVLTIYKIGPTFISKLANRILENQNEVRECVKELIKNKLLERVENIMVEYKTKEANVVVKHRNHTYYKLTKNGEKKAKELEEDEFEVREAFKTYNKALQNKLDNVIENTEKRIYCVIDFPYSQELNVKNILNEKFENLQKEYGHTITLRGDITEVEKEKLLELPNIIII
ncbi:DUF2250 domain-containing protein [Cetobacterium somerae]|uniref:DUF2250 domain-containing protein n=1 Tax=Cetobacterium TaxID=180162 RepID=UPI001F051282|nr:DUF2250 domain-containing protein [Cetobacterium somerae]MCQ9625879.1 DUF2250 domain-containing protein [Cetobacterium somerae]MCX3067605.1 DUF2250 domain-containing protein [Cetobacterium somerae]UPO97513.1 DUF2250 domain-containing protein [Cetobacterium somerae]